MKKTPQRLLVIAVIALSAMNALVWVVTVPIFQSADEDLHFDYVMSIYSAGRLLLTRELPVAHMRRTSAIAPNAHPVTHHLAVRTHLERVRFNPDEKMPPDYGTRASFDRVNATMPPDDPQLRNPWLITQYPFGYYALAAAWLRALHLSTPVALIFGARVLSVLLLITSLSFGYAYLRRIGTPPPWAIGVLFISGIFPLTAFVSSYVQPDNLSFALTVATCYAAIVARDAMRANARLNPAFIATSFLIGFLLVTKYQFFLCVAVPVILMLAVEAGARRAVLLLIPSLVTGAIQINIHRGAVATWHEQTTLAARHEVIASLGVVRYTCTRFVLAIFNYFGGGPSWRGFMGVFGWYDTPLLIGSEGTTAFVQTSMLAVTITLLGLVAARLCSVALRLIRLARKRRLAALRIALSNPMANSYFMFVCFMIAIYVWQNNYSKMQARNWLPYTMILFWLAVRYAPRVFRRLRTRRLIARATLLIFALYAVLGALCAIPVLRARYYG